MVKKIVGYDENGKVAFEREARAYDRSIGNTVFGITLADAIKIGTVLVACSMFYINSINFKEYQMSFNKQVLDAERRQDAAIDSITMVLSNINNYLSSTTQKQFKDGRPL